MARAPIQDSDQPYRENYIIASGQVWAKFYIERYRKTLILLQYIFIHKGYHSCANGSVILITLWWCKSQMYVFKVQMTKIYIPVSSLQI